MEEGRERQSLVHHSQIRRAIGLPSLADDEVSALLGIPADDIVAGGLGRP